MDKRTRMMMNMRHPHMFDPRRDERYYPRHPMEDRGGK